MITRGFCPAGKEQIMTKQDIINRLEDLMNEMRFEDIEGVSEGTIEATIYGLQSLINTVKNDED